jgi:hypothetical protein
MGTGRNAQWPSILAIMAAAGRNDGGVGLTMLVDYAGLKKPPAMKIIVSRETILRRSLGHDPG